MGAAFALITMTLTIFGAHYFVYKDRVLKDDFAVHLFFIPLEILSIFGIMAIFIV